MKLTLPSAGGAPPRLPPFAHPSPQRDSTTGGENHGPYLPWRFALALIATALGGCAIKYQDPQGQLHILGFTAVTITPATENPAKATRVGTQNVGAMIYATAASRGVSLGYNREEVFYENVVLAPSAP